MYVFYSLSLSLSHSLPLFLSLSLSMNTYIEEDDLHSQPLPSTLT
jgi:hypothetical protein